VVVGIDGSRAAVRAALWAVDASVSRDIPLRLICAIAPDGSMQFDPRNEARRLATAELAIRYAHTAVESAEKPVKIEVQIVKGTPVQTLIEASRSAAVLCVGALGMQHFAPDRVGSTAATLASSAQCAVAIIRGRDRPASDRGEILAFIGTSPDDGAVLQAALDEARLRGLRVHVLTAWQARDVHDHLAIAEGNRNARGQLDRLVGPWAQRYRDVEISRGAVHGRLLDHVADRLDSVVLVVTGVADAADLVGPEGSAVLHSFDCSLLIISRRHL